MRNNNLFKAAGFLLVFALLFSLVNGYFNPGNDVRNEKAAFYQEPKDSLEVIFCGSSSILRDIAPMELYKDYGIASYSMATTLQAPPITEFSVKEALKYQSPKVLVMNMESAALAYPYSSREGQLHTALDPYRFSLHKLEAIRAACSFDEKQSIWDYLFPVVRYHDAWWQGEEFESLERSESYRKGYVGMTTSIGVSLGENYMTASGKPVTYLEESLKYYRDAIQAAQDAGVPVLIIKLPRTTWTLEEHEALSGFAAQMGVDFLDFNTAELWQATQLDLQTDFYDPNHLCHTGAVKLTRVLGEYLQTHYDLTDIRDSSGSERWEDSLVQYESAYDFCLHESSQEGTVTFSLSAQRGLEGLTCQWTVYHEQEAILRESGECFSISAAIPAGRYYASCTVLRGDTEIATLKTDTHTMK